MADSLTILRARGRRLAKLVKPGGALEGYDSARTVDLHHRDVSDLAALHRLLGNLSARPDCCIVRGAIRDPHRVRRVRRLLHDDKATGEAATLRDVPRHWLGLDLDGIDLPASTAPADLAGCAAAAVARLPDAFTGAACIVQATASHGIKPGARLRLWFWCDRALSGAECKRWLAAAPVDRSVFGAAQPLYTAAPVFPAGLADHLPARILLLPGRETVATPSVAALASPPRRPASPPRAATGSRYALAALTRAAAQIATAPEGGRHDTAKAAAWGLARLVRAGLLSEAEVKQTIGNAIAAAGKDSAEGEAIAAWAIAHRRDGAVPEGVRR